MKIQERVFEAVAAGVSGDFAKGMTLICPAIEATARKKFGVSKIDQKLFKDFLRSYHFILEPFIGAGINLVESRFPQVTLKTDDGKVIKSPDFADIIYHAFRCSTAHGHEIQEEFLFTQSAAQGISLWKIDASAGRINMPDKVLWALIACVVFCKANEDIASTTTQWLTWGGAPVERDPPYQFDIDVFWGGEELVKGFFEKKNLLRVAIVHP